MLIVYCDKCGMRIQQKDLDAGTVVINDDRYTCPKCAGSSVPVTADVPMTEMAGEAETGRPSARATPSKPMRVTARMATKPADKRPSGASGRQDSRAPVLEAAAQSNRTPLFIAGGGGAILVIALLVMMLKGKNPPENVAKDNKSGSEVALVADPKPTSTGNQLQVQNPPTTVVENPPKVDTPPKPDETKTDPKTGDDKTRALPSWMRAEPETISRQPAVGEYVWIDDELPRGAVATGNTEANAWKWTTTPAPAMGTQSHTYSGASHRGPGETQQHFFEKCADSLRVGSGDTLFAYVYIDPANPPKEIMMQWRFNDSWEHRAYWGDNLIPFGMNFSPSRLPMGPLPKAGEWVRLEIPAQSIGLDSVEDRVIGWSFDNYGGVAYWDKAGVVRVPVAKPEPKVEPKQSKLKPGETGTVAKVTWKDFDGGKDFKNFSGKGKDSRAIWAKPTGVATMKAKFTLPEGNYGAGLLMITELRHGAKDGCQIEIILNGTQIFNGRDAADKQREWAILNYRFAENVLKTGVNEIQINNTEDQGKMGEYPWYMLNKIEIESTLR